MTTIDSRPRIGFLGVGWIGRHRFDAIRHSGLATVVAVADTSAETARQAADAEPGIRAVASAEALFACDLDGVVIATPTGLHAGQCIDAFHQRLAVFCQKPLAPTAVETRRVVASARAADRLLSVDFSYRHLASAIALKTAVQSGSVGDVFAVNLVFHNAYGPDKSWALERGLAGGGCLIDLGVHLVDLAMWVLDFPTVCDARGHLFAGGQRVTNCANAIEDFASATLTLESGAIVTMTCSWHAQTGRDAVIEATFHGTRGTAALQNVAGSFYDFACHLHRGTNRQPLAADSEGWGGRAAVTWVQALTQDHAFDAGAERAVDVASVLDRIYHP